MARLRKGVMAAGLLMLSACAVAQEGRYIVYVDAATGNTLKTTAEQEATAAAWGQTLGGEIHFERQLGTGGWVITVNSPAGSAEAQLKKLQSLPGVETVERDAIMRIK